MKYKSRKRTKRKKPPKGYDSVWESELHLGKLSDYIHHPSDTIAYEVPHTYEIDFLSKDGKLLVESKGRFRDSAEARKYIYIRSCLGEGQELVFIFQDASTPMPRARVRKKCGTKFTHGEWAKKNGFRYWDYKQGGRVKYE